MQVQIKSHNPKPLSTDLYRKIQLAIEESMVEDRMYLRDDLSLHQYAKELNTNTSYLSRIIGETYQMSFTSYLNALRIKHVKELIADRSYESYSIDEIARLSGYRSKSTFYKAFKVVMGMSPKKFRMQVRKNQQ